MRAFFCKIYFLLLLTLSYSSRLIYSRSLSLSLCFRMFFRLHSSPRLSFHPPLRLRLPVWPGDGSVIGPFTFAHCMLSSLTSESERGKTEDATPLSITFFVTASDWGKRKKWKKSEKREREREGESRKSWADKAREWISWIEGGRERERKSKWQLS